MIEHAGKYAQEAIARRSLTEHEKQRRRNLWEMRTLRLAVR